MTDARKTLDEYLAVVEERRYKQGSIQRVLGQKEADLLARLYKIADEYDSLKIVDLCPDRDDPDHWKVDCWACDHEGMAFIMPPNEVKQVEVEVTYQGKAKPLVQLEMFSNDDNK